MQTRWFGVLGGLGVLIASCTPPFTGGRPAPPTPAPTSVPQALATVQPPTAPDAIVPTSVPIQPTVEVISGAQVPLREVVVGVWCTEAFESMVGTTMQCLALVTEGSFRLGVVVNGNVNPQSVLSGTYLVSETGIMLNSTQRPTELLVYTGNAGRPRLIDSTGRFTFEPYGRQSGSVPIP